MAISDQPTNIKDQLSNQIQSTATTSATETKPQPVGVS
ncbi:unnamed protein product [Trichobilharzia regenti]|nr:unnamed protein product [Trichobilharzia regenti]